MPNHVGTQTPASSPSRMAQAPSSQSLLVVQASLPEETDSMPWLAEMASSRSVMSKAAPNFSDADWLSEPSQRKLMLSW